MFGQRQRSQGELCIWTLHSSGPYVHQLTRLFKGEDMLLPL